MCRANKLVSFINSATSNKRDSCPNHKCESLGHELGEWESGKEEGSTYVQLQWLSSIVPRLFAGGGKRAWYALFAHVRN